MEIKEIWTEFKDRITSPFFGSFVISWLIWNWQIPVVLLFYKLEDLVEAKTTYIDFILRHQSFWFMIFFPAAFAFSYTFGYPHFKRWINTYTAKQTLKTEEALLRLGETAPVSQDKFLGMHAELKKNKNALAALLIEESAYMNRNEELEGVVSSLRLEITSLINTHQDNLNHLTTSNSEHQSRVNIEQDKAVTELQALHNDRINAIRGEHLRQTNLLGDEILQKDGAISTLNAAVDKLRISEKELIDQGVLKDHLIDELEVEMNARAESERVLQGIIDAKNVELESKDGMMGNVQNAFRRVVAGDIKALSSSILSLETLKDEVRNNRGLNKLEIINDASEIIDNRLNLLQNEAALDPLIRELL